MFVAAAGQAGTLGVDDCAPAAPISFLHIHGAADVNIPIDGGRGQGISGVAFPSPRDSIRAARRRRTACPADRGARRPRPGDHRDVGTVRRRHNGRVRDGRGRDARVDGRGRADAARRPGAVRRVRQQRGGLVVPRRPPAPIVATAASTAAPFTRSCARSRERGIGPIERIRLRIITSSSSRAASRRNSSPSARVFAVTLRSCRSWNRCRS